MGHSKLKNLWYCGILLWSDRKQGIAYPRFADAGAVACRVVAVAISLFQVRIWFQMASDQMVAQSLSPLWMFESVTSIFCCSSVILARAKYTLCS